MDVSVGEEKLLRKLCLIDSRVDCTLDLLSKGLKEAELVAINGFLKAASIGIVAKDNEKMYPIKALLLKKFSEETPKERRHLYWVLNSILKELPIQKKFMNRGPIRHGILGFKDHVVHGDNWLILGPAGDFPKTIHQLSHQIPAPALGYICKAYAAYLRNEGSIEAFDRVLSDNRVNFEAYFVENAKRISQNADSGATWCHISPHKPKGILRVSDEDMHNALGHRNWSGKNIDELMSKPEPKTATFFELYGDTILQALEGQSHKPSITIKDLDLFLKPETKKNLLAFEDLIQKTYAKSSDKAWNQITGYPKILKLVSTLRKEIQSDILSTKDTNKLSSLLTLDKSLESSLDNTAMKILSQAPKEKGLLYKLDPLTENLLIHLIENYTLSVAKNSLEMNMLSRDFKATFSSSRQDPISWAQNTMVSLSRLDRLIQQISKDTSDTYRPMAQFLSQLNNIHRDDKKAEELTDGILRGELLFPISQICNGFKSELRKLSQSSPWQILSSGSLLGKVIHAHNMEDLRESLRGLDVPREKRICLIDSIVGTEEPPPFVHAILTPRMIDTLSHIGVRSRQEKIIFLSLEEPTLYEEIKKNFSSPTSYMHLQAMESDKILFNKLSPGKYRLLERKEDRIYPRGKTQKVQIPLVDLSTQVAILAPEQIKFSNAGPKANNISKLTKILPVPPTLAIPFGVFHQVLKAPVNQNIFDEYTKLEGILYEKQKAKNTGLYGDCQKIKQHILNLQIPDGIGKEITEKVQDTMPPGTEYIMTRSSTNGEDLSGFSGAGLYTSQPQTMDNILTGIKIVWASKWNKRAFDARVKALIPHEDLHVAVLIQPCIDAQYGFVTHTTNPINLNPNEIFIEIVQGQNEALVSGSISGRAYAFVYHKKSAHTARIHLADKSYQFLPSEEGAMKIALADYKQDKFAGDKNLWEKDLQKIAGYCLRIEKLYGGVPQDIEGCIQNGSGEIYIVQTREQVGLN